MPKLIHSTSSASIITTPGSRKRTPSDLATGVQSICETDETAKRLRTQEKKKPSPPTPPPPCLKDLPEQGWGIVLSEQEWNGLRGGGVVILRSFRTSQDDLLVVLRTGISYCLVGRIIVGSKTQRGNNDKAEDLVSSLYSKETAAALLKSSKALWDWKVQEVIRFDQEVHLPWMDNRFRNRVFQLDLKQAALSKSTSQVPYPRRLDLADTASYMFQCWPLEKQKALLDVLDRLKGAPLRVGTTCSGSDVCISVLKQTLAHFASTQVWYIYIYIEWYL